jgi:hypothetical protein
MSGPPRTASERLERFRRDEEAYRRRSLSRRSHARFRRDLAVVPHLFLLPSRARMAQIQQPVDTVRLALRGEAIWTLDTASRLVSARGFLLAADLTGYMTDRSFARLIAEGLIGSPLAGGLTLDPLFDRPPMLIAHLTEEPPTPVELPTGELVVPWDFLVRDILGTLGWRPDLLTRLEASYPGSLPN